MATFTFTSSGPLTLPDNASVSSSIATYGLASFSVAYTVSVTLHGLNHTFADDLDMQLVSPDFRDLVFWSDAGGNNDLQGDYTISDSAPTLLPDTGVIPAGSYRPINYGADETASHFGSFSGPTHATGAIGEFLNRFNGATAEGNWTLYIRDDLGGDTGSLEGWSLTITTLSDRVFLDGTADADVILAVRTSLGTGAYQMNDLPAVTFTGVNAFQIDAKGGNDIVYGSATADSITGGAGRDSIYAGGGSDTLRISTGENVAGEVYDGGGGTDTLRIASGSANFRDDTVLSIERLELNASSAVFDAAQIGPGLAANAAVAGIDDFVDPETLEVFQYADVFEVRLSSTTTVDLSGLTFIAFANPLDRIRVFGDESAETITGTALNDVINGGANADTMFGLAGNDTYYVDAAGDGVAEAVGNGFDTVLTSVSFILGATQEIEVLKAANAAATAAVNLTGNEFANQITGNAGANQLFGGGANDTLFGLGGADVLTGGAGFDTLTGGGGADQFRFDNAAQVGIAAGQRDIITDFQQGIDLIRLDGFDALTTVAGLQHFTWMGTAAHSGAGASLRYVQSGGNTLISGDLDANGSNDFTIQLNGLYTLTAADFTALSIDRIQGTAGNDTLTGAPGGKVMSGLGGNDTMTGGTGADIFYGGAGADTMTGLAGADQFRFTAPSNSGTTALTRDVITDFEQGTDKIHLADIDANTTIAGNQAFTFVGAAAHTGAGATLRYAQSGGDTIVYGDVDANGTDDFSIQLDGLYTLGANDFVL